MAWQRNVNKDWLPFIVSAVMPGSPSKSTPVSGFWRYSFVIFQHSVKSMPGLERTACWNKLWELLSRFAWSFPVSYFAKFSAKDNDIWRHELLLLLLPVIHQSAEILRTKSEPDKYHHYSFALTNRLSQRSFANLFRLLQWLSLPWYSRCRRLYLWSLRSYTLRTAYFSKTH